jgi:hypothetical protein
MNIKIKDDTSKILEKICRNTNQTPSELIESFVDTLYPLYLDYMNRINADIEKRSFNQILSDLFKHISNSTVENLELAPKLIEITDSLLGIKNHIGASVFDIKLDFDKRTISYDLGYQVCTSSAYVYTALAISVEMNQDYIQISQLMYEPVPESMQITNADLSGTEDLIQDFIEDTYSKKLLPLANLSVHLHMMGSHPFEAKADLHEFIQIELTLKADEASNIPPIEKTGTLANEVRDVVREKLLKKQ